MQLLTFERVVFRHVSTCHFLCTTLRITSIVGLGLRDFKHLAEVAQFVARCVPQGQEGGRVHKSNLYMYGLYLNKATL